MRPAALQIPAMKAVRMLRSETAQILAAEALRPVTVRAEEALAGAEVPKAGMLPVTAEVLKSAAVPAAAKPGKIPETAETARLETAVPKVPVLIVKAARKITVETLRMEAVRKLIPKKDLNL